MKILVTGIAGFIGFHLARHLHEHGYDVCGVDNLNAYYSVALKKARLEALPAGVTFVEQDIADAHALEALLRTQRPDMVVHLAAQAGVRHSLKKPMDYAHSNLTGQVSILEAAAKTASVSHVIYASSSSVYGAALNTPCTEDLPADQPASLYGATKRSGELIASAYAHLHQKRTTGLRFFTVYGSWGRPDMAYWIFSERLLSGAPIDVFDQGAMRRDMTHVSDVVRCIRAVIESPNATSTDARLHAIYNIGFGEPQNLLDMIGHLERLSGRSAHKVFKPAPPGDVADTWAHMQKFRADFGIAPEVRLEAGLSEFYEWFSKWKVIA